MRYEVFYKHHRLDGRALRVRRTIEHALDIKPADTHNRFVIGGADPAGFYLHHHITNARGLGSRYRFELEILKAVKNGSCHFFHSAPGMVDY
jgi:hypothetical protein